MTGAKLSRQVALAGFISVLIAGLAAGTAPAFADSCWLHNGSLMRLKATGANRSFYYENPRAVLRRAGVRRGTLLFNGTKRGNFYSGLARRFSRFCPGEPQEYWVEGPVSPNQTTVVVRGTRQVFKRCQDTGAVASDELVFTYSHQC